MKQLPDGRFGDKNDYRLDYMVFSASSSLEEENKLWDFPLIQVYKRMMFKRFDSWLEWSMTDAK